MRDGGYKSNHPPGTSTRHTISPQNSYMTGDAIIVSTGFGGIYHLIYLRGPGLRCKLIKAGSDFGGTWCWNILLDRSTIEYLR